MEVRPLDILKILITKEQIHDVDKRNSSNEDNDVFENIYVQNKLKIWKIISPKLCQNDPLNPQNYKLKKIK